MTPVRRIGKNLVFKTVTEFIGRVLSFVFYVALARWLGEAAFGAFSLLYSVTAMLVFIVDPGLNMSLIRKAPRSPGFLESMSGPALGLKLSLSAVMVAASAAYGFLGGYEANLVLLFALMGVQMAAFALVEYASAIFQARERMEMETLFMGVSKTAVTGLALAALFMGAQLAAVILVMTAAQMAAAFWALWRTSSFVGLRPGFAPASWGGLLKESVPLAAVIFCTIALYRIDVAIIPFLGVTLEQIGWYSAGVKLLDVLIVIPSISMAAAFPTLSGLAGTDHARFRKWTSLGVAGLAAAGLAAWAGAWFFSAEIVTGVFGPRFEPASGPMRWLGAAAVAIFVRHGLQTALVLDGRFRSAAYLTGGAALANVGLNLFLVPGFGILGAAMAKFFSDAALAAAMTLVWAAARHGADRPSTG